jgi:predicted MFS family arabinose efflux permease
LLRAAVPGCSDERREGDRPPLGMRRAWRTGDLRPLADPGIRGMAIARFMALLGGSALPTALAFGVLALEGGSATALGLVMAVASLGQVVFLIPGGVVADRWSRKRVLVLSEATTGLSLLALGLIYASGHASVATMALLAGVAGAAGGFFYPAATGFVPEMSPPAELQATNAILRMTANVARIAGTAAAGIIVAFLGAGWAVVTSGVLALGATVVLVRLKPRFSAPHATASNPFVDLAEGWREFIARRWVVAIVVAGAVSSFGSAAFFGVLGPLRMEESGGASEWALITAALALGLLVGAAAALRIHPRRPLVVAVTALGLYSLPMFALAIPTPLAVAVAAAFVAGVSLDIFAVLWDTALQQRVPREALSRVSSFDWLGTFALSPIALGVAGPVVLALGLSNVLWGAALLAAMAPLALLEPEVRGIVTRSR